MNRIAITALTLLCVTAGLDAAEKSEPIKVGSYNLCTSDSRVKKIQQGRFTSTQRYWSNSADAVARMIAGLDCDLIGLQEICDSIWSDGPDGLRARVDAVRGDNDYDWILYPNTPKGRISYDSAIGFKKSRFKLMDSDIFWMTQTPESPYAAKDAPRGSTRPAVWALFKDLRTGKQLYFVSTHLVLGSMYNDGGNEYNAECFIDAAEGIFKSKIPSIVVGDFNSGYSCKGGKQGQGFKTMCSTRWTDTYLSLKEMGRGMSDETLKHGTQPLPDESGFSNGIIDHILYDRLEPVSFTIDSRKLPTADGTLHFPSDHLPIIAVFE